MNKSEMDRLREFTYGYIQSYAVEVSFNPNEILSLLDTVDKMRAALEFYADEKNEYEGVFGTPESPQIWEENPICYYEQTQYRHLAWWKYDRGEVARKALKGTE